MEDKNLHLMFYSAAYTELSKNLLGYLKIGAMVWKYVNPADELLIGHIVLLVQEKGLDALWRFKGFKNEYQAQTMQGFKSKGIDLERASMYEVSRKEIKAVSSPGEGRKVGESMFTDSQVHTSTNYEQFQYLPFNRPVSPAHVQEIIESMILFGNISTCVMVITSCITGTEGIYVADGQHRLAAEKKTGRQVFYHLVRIEDKVTLIKLIAMLNATSKKWAIKDYLRAWCSLGIPEYVNILDQLKKTKLPISSLLEAYSGLNRTLATKLFMEGNFPTPDLEKGNDLVNCILELHTLGLAPWNRQFLGCAIRLLRNSEFKYEVLKQKLMNMEEKVQFSKREAEITQQLVEIYAS